MKIIKTITLLMLSAALTSCSAAETVYNKLNGYTDYDYQEINIDEFNEKVNKLLDDIKITDNESAVRDDVQVLLEQANIASDAMAYSSVESYRNWDNSELDEKCDNIAETFYVICSAVGYAFSKGYVSDEYSHIFKDLVTDEDVEYFTQKGITLGRVEGYASVDYRISDEYLDDYYEISYDDSLDDDEKNLKCAEVYLDILKNVDIDDYYSDYNRDYTPDDILRLSDTVRKQIIPVSEKFYNNFSDTLESEEIWDIGSDGSKIFETIRDYSDKLSPTIKESADKLIDDKLYTIASGENCYTGSFTSDLPSDNSALIYVYSDDTFLDLMTAVHEFGHFHASFYDDVNAYLMQQNLDIAEVQSQGMELMFMQFYDDIYGENADILRNYKLYDLTDSIVMGFLVGEFEYRALLQADELTPQEVVDLYSEVMGEYEDDFPFYYISHMYESPGYYISYGVSALAALDMLDECENDPDKALEMYESIAAVPMNEKDVYFTDSLKKCGFSDVLSEEYISALAKELERYA